MVMIHSTSKLAKCRPGSTFVLLFYLQVAAICRISPIKFVTTASGPPRLSQSYSTVPSIAFYGSRNTGLWIIGILSCIIQNSSLSSSFLVHIFCIFELCFSAFVMHSPSSIEVRKNVSQSNKAFNSYTCVLCVCLKRRGGRFRQNFSRNLRIWYALRYYN